MKKVLFLFGFLSLASICSLMLVTGHATNNLSKVQEFTLDDNNISFALSKVWKEKFSQTHDLALSKLDTDLYFSVYKKADIDMSAEELLNAKLKEELADYESKSLVKKYNVNKTRNRTIYSKLYTATKDNIETQYLFNVIEFDDSDTYVFAIYTARGSYMQYSIDDIQRLLIKMEWNGSKTELALN